MTLTDVAYNITPMSEASTLPRKTVLAVAVSADVDPRTVIAYLAGRRVWEVSRIRIVRALRSFKRPDLIRTAPAEAA